MDLRCRLGLLACAALAAAACTLDFDAVGPSAQGGDAAAGGPSVGGQGLGGSAAGGDAPQGGAGPGGGGGGVGGAPSPCADSRGTCIDPPTGFLGPVALVQGVCAGPTSFTAGPDFVDQDAICNCGCGPASANCDLGSNLTYAHSSPNCSDGNGGTTFSPAAGACTQTPQPGGSPARSVKFMGSAELPECVSNNLPATVPTPQLVEPRTACEIGSDGCETGQACIPVSADPICFYKPDDQVSTCPSGYVMQHLFQQHEHIESRDCTCTCGAGSGVCGLVSFDMHTSQTCADAPVAPVNAAGCWHDSTNGPFAGVVAYAPANLTCNTAFSQDGAITPSGGLLVCCLP